MRHLRLLHNDRGETLIEVLASILIVSLSVMLLLGCVMSSSNIDEDAEKLDEAHYNALSQADAQVMPTPAPGEAAPTPTGGSVVISAPSGSPDVTQEIMIYGGEGMYSYKRG